MDVGTHKVDVNIKPEFVISTGYDPIKSEETDDEEESDQDINTSNVQQSINIKQEAVKVKEEEDICTNDVQRSKGYHPELESIRCIRSYFYTRSIPLYLVYFILEE